MCEMFYVLLTTELVFSFGFWCGHGGVVLRPLICVEFAKRCTLLTTSELGLDQRQPMN